MRLRVSSRFDRKDPTQITNSFPPRPRVLTLAAYPTITYGLRAAVESDDALSYAGNVSEWGALSDRLADGDVQVILADIDWSEDDLAGAGGLVDLPPALLLAEDADAGYAALAVGFRGVLLRDSDVDEILQAIKTLVLGLAVIDPRVLPLLQTSETRRSPKRLDIESLSPRETEVLDLIARGLPNKAIALELGISEHTVKFHVGSVLSKFNASSRSEAVAIAMRHGLVKV
jgi:DNA-binding NarL/FixJ family response regulator